VDDPLDGRHIVLCVTGGIAAYKSCELVRRLQDHGTVVQVVMTKSACEFVGPATFQALSQRPVFVDQWDARIHNGMGHIELSREADAILIAPASANTLAKIANGIADDLVSVLCLARECPLLVAPAMNLQMWANPATQRNAATLARDGVVILGPDSGSQACGEFGDGRMLEVSDLIDRLQSFFTPKILDGRRVVMTAGPTFEAIDPVRGLTNRSSGKMGYAIARAAHHAGADVTLVSGPTAEAHPFGVTVIEVESAAQMLAEVQRHVIGATCFIGVAAVADWGIKQFAGQKIKKNPNGKTPALELTENPDILALVAALPNPPYCVGFAAETETLEEHAAAKRIRKKIPLIVANLAQDTMDQDQAELILIDADATRHLPRASKVELARLLVREIASRLS
jgi:phosphopantothenoylcysteine decarboxylase / phosphopantothenate---cysteine ligase